jgi:hypothetical protein
MIAVSEGGLQKLMDGLGRAAWAAKYYDMKINVKQTKVMKVSKHGIGDVNITVDGVKGEQVDKLKYLGSWMTAIAMRDVMPIQEPTLGWQMMHLAREKNF